MQYSLRKRAFKLSRKQLVALITIIVLSFIGVAFAGWQTKFEINGAIAVKNPKWDVHFENLDIDSGSVTTDNPAAISEDKRKITFSVSLSNQNDYYQFETDIVNNGLIDGMVSDAKIVGLPDALKDYVNCKLTYADDIEIKNNDALRVSDNKKVVVRIEFKENVDITSLPSKDAFELGLEVFYVRATDEAADVNVVVKAPFFEIMLAKNTAYMDNEASKFVTSETGINFVTYSSDTNGRGLYIYKGTESNDYPIYYYRGAVTNNNLIFADFCWKIVRTTETGGIKLIYNGEPTGTNRNQCGATGLDTQLASTSPFNSSNTRSPYVGYTYGSSSTLRGSTNSKVKTAIDTWYRNNILDKYDSFLEDTIFCADRNSTISNKNTYYGTYTRLKTNKQKPIVTCPLSSDSYTVKNTSSMYNENLNGNKILDYPVGLLTADEADLAGITGYYENGSTYSIDSYLINGGNFWLMSPYEYYSSQAYVYYIRAVSGGSYLDGTYVTYSYGVRPSISLKNGVIVTVGGGSEMGSTKNPYIVVEN